MNDEIKEILKEIECYRNEELCLIFLSREESNALLDYITNLQQENERLKEENKHIFANVNDDELLISNAMNYAEARDYKSRCEKAIEYIKGTTFFGLRSGKTFMSKYLNDLLNILQNGDGNN